MIQLKNISKKYGDLSVFDGLNLQLAEDKITCLLGKSGCGKTTLLNVLAGITDYDGQIEGFDGKVSYIFQRERLLPNLTVRQNLQYVLDKSDYGKIDDMLELLEILPKADNYPRQLSGGQAQRVAIARAFLYPSKLLLMDEPFSSLDTALKIRLIEAFYKTWQADKRAVLFVTHDVEEAFMLANRVLVLKTGDLTENLKKTNGIEKNVNKETPTSNLMTLKDKSSRCYVGLDINMTGDPIRQYGTNTPQKQQILDELLLD